jgi:hypothetical protein
MNMPEDTEMKIFPIPSRPFPLSRGYEKKKKTANNVEHYYRNYQVWYFNRRRFEIQVFG